MMEKKKKEKKNATALAEKKLCWISSLEHPFYKHLRGSVLPKQRCKIVVKQRRWHFQSKYTKYETQTSHCIMSSAEVHPWYL